MTTAIKFQKPKTKSILTLLADGILLSSLFLFPNAAAGIYEISKMYKYMKREEDFWAWEQFNLPRLRFLLQRLHKQKVITISENGDYTTIQLTQKGIMRALRYKLEDMKLKKPERWDKKWRIVIYDITKFKRKQQEAFRRMLRKLNMLPLQKSVYLSPYPCEDEMKFLREYFNVGEGVLYITATHIENEDLYCRYFGI